ncbi:hypothetical protein G6O45_29450, partial [Salmonella enterica subsp. enterica serovar Istanbul]|nr:hypothetical protein [Salmonella enterica subsp. enterica serovar Istanbul]
GYLRKQAGEQLADSYERELFKIPASQIRGRYEEMLAEGHRLLAIKATLGGIAANVRLELRRTFEHDLPPADGSASSEKLRSAVAAIGGNLRPAL